MPVNGVELISRNGRAPRAASARTSLRTLSRYCALFGVQGVSRFAPFSSLSAIHGVAHWVCEAAKTKRRLARSSIDAGSNGSVVVPTRERRFMSQ